MKTLTLENKDELIPYIAASDYNEYNSNIVTMLMWSNMYELQFETYEHYAIALTKMPHHPTIWMMPYGAQEYRKEAVDKIKQRAKELGIPFEIHSMTTEFKNWLQANYLDEFLVWDCYDAQDYIYDRVQQETLVGKKMQKRRNHFHAFLKEYEHRYIYKALEDQDIPNIYDFFDTWKSSKENDTSIDAEEIGIHLLLDNLHTLPIQGGCIYIDGKLEAFNITSKLSDDTFQIHVEKANRNIRGLYIAILKFYLETLDSNILYINREDDLGLEDLRKAKRDMQPISKTRKFGCCHQAIEIVKATEDYLPQIKALWQEQFKDETVQSTNYYFEHIFHADDCYLLVSDHELITMIHNRKMKIMMNGKIQTVSFLVGVATNKEYEGCGYMKRLMNYVFEDIKHNEAYVLLQAYEPTIYKAFGFVEQYTLSKTKLDKTSYTMEEGTLSYQFDTNQLLAIYQAFTNNKDGYRIRDISYYEQWLAYTYVWGQKVVVHTNQDGCADAYLQYEENDSEIQIHECIYTNEEALQATLSSFHSDKKIYVTSDIDTCIVGRRKTFTTMMLKQLQGEESLANNLFIHEEM